MLHGALAQVPGDLLSRQIGGGEGFWELQGFGFGGLGGVGRAAFQKVDCRPCQKLL